MENDDLQQELDRVLADYVPGTAGSGSAIATTSYKGMTVPSNSALLKQDTTVLAAYKSLIADNEANSNANGRVPSIIDAQLSALPLFITAPDSLSFNVQLLINTLPVLDNLATQILRIITKGPYQKVMELVSNRESSYSGIAFSNLVELFETTKRVYNSEESPFFTVENVTFGLWRFGEPSPSFLRGREDTIEGTLRKVNLATFLLATLGLIDLGFFFLNEAFLDVFCPPQNLDPSESLSNLKHNDTFISNDPTMLNSSSKSFNQQRASTKFLKAQALLYLELKTQAYISALELGDRSREEIIADLFPEKLPEIILHRRDTEWKHKLDELNGGKLSDIVTHGDFKPSSQILNKVKVVFTPAEYDFLQRCTLRKSTLLKESNLLVSNSEANLSQLMEKYEWVRFLNDLLDYVSKNVGFLIWGPKGKISMEFEKRKIILNKRANLVAQSGGALNNLNTIGKPIIGNNNNSNINTNTNTTSNTVDENRNSSGNDTNNNINNSNNSNNNNNNDNTNETSLPLMDNDNNNKKLEMVKILSNKRSMSEAEIEQESSNVTISGEHQTPLNSEPLPDLTPGRPTAKKSKNRPATFRRVWTEEEESALREGLKVKGTQWTAILELFGPGGRINESLKNRSSLQLKDKARNWKMWYLKNHVEVPTWLMGASGGISKNGSKTPVTSDNEMVEVKSKDIPKPLAKTKAIKSLQENKNSSMDIGSQSTESNKDNDEVSEDQYDAMLSLLAKSADHNEDIAEADLVKHLTASPELQPSETKQEQITDKEVQVGVEVEVEVENDDHNELKNLVAEAFQQ